MQPLCGLDEDGEDDHDGEAQAGHVLVGDALVAQVHREACVENMTAQDFGRQIMPQAAPSFRQPRAISRLGRAGRPCRTYVRLRVEPDELKREGGVRIMSSSLGRLSSA